MATVSETWRAPEARYRFAEASAAIADAAGARIMAIHGRAAPTAKADGSPLTEADLAAQGVIAAGLAAAWPGLPVISEEDLARRDSAPDQPFILVDPLDGTREFLSGNGEFTVNIALILDGVPVAGVVCAPALGRQWLGARGAGAWLKEGGEMRPIAARRPPQRDLIAVASRSHRDAETEAFLARLPIGGIRSVGSSLKFCLVAMAEADVYPRFGPTMEWDTAAGQAVLEAAGGRVLTPEGAPLRYGKPGWRNGAFIAWGAAAGEEGGA
jgi:3'(2'), 5'-bisphosphate nucleotidase